jgi:hypothetical protein
MNPWNVCERERERVMMMMMMMMITTELIPYNFRQKLIYKQ